ncbi:sensor histidine kinase [Agaribacterium sp. ZY112]|uniref:sensor histidine kinase n=1 Tax=Agaribacterium sp. ZY112 TaxID=3233574 RepID=UPI003523AA4E
MIFLIQRGYKQFQKEEFHKYVWHAQHLIKQVRDDINPILEREENRAYNDYYFYNISDDPRHRQEYLTMSPLSGVPDSNKTPGIIGYFQIDDQGIFSCPALPFEDNQSLLDFTHKLTPDFDEEQIKQSLKLRKKLRALLVDNGLISGPKPFDLGAFPELPSELGASSSPASEPKEYLIQIQPLTLIIAKSGELIFSRQVWKGEAQLSQGFILNPQDFLYDPLQRYLNNSGFQSKALVQIYYKDQILGALSYTPKISEGPSIEFNSYKQNKLPITIFWDELHPALKPIKILISTEAMPLGASASTGIYLVLVIVFLILLGAFIIYQLGIRQIRLNEDRLNFVSSVSHELKTPLTSIIMYADMLRSNMINSNQQRETYYDFIFFEGERLSRLISNILCLSSLRKKDASLRLEYTPVLSAVDLVKSKTRTLIEKSQFELKLLIDKEELENLELLIDVDAFAQIAINLIDNAIKFSTDHCDKNQRKRLVELGFSSEGKDSPRLCFWVRDYGPGVASEDCKHIFDLFYRSGNELTRKTQGTGIGLALVGELVRAMGAKVDHRNRHPGAEFEVCFQYRKQPRI